MISAADINWQLGPAPDDGDPGDLVIEALVDAQAYRLLAQQALHALHQVSLERDVLRGQRIIDRRLARAKAAA